MNTNFDEKLIITAAWLLPGEIVLMPVVAYGLCALVYGFPDVIHGAN